MQPDEIKVISRAALRAKSDTGLDYLVPAELWARPLGGPLPNPFPVPGPEELRAAYDDLIHVYEKVDRTLNLKANPLMLRKFAHAHIRRYRALGEPDSLVAARAIARRVADVSPTSAERAKAVTIRAIVEMHDYLRYGDVELLRESVVAYRDALACDPTNAVAAGGLGSALQSLADWDDPALLDSAIDALRRAVTAAGGDRAIRLNNLGSALSQRWENTHSQHDLTEAAVALVEALELTPEDSSDAAARLNNLGTVRLRAYLEVGGQSMLDTAIDALERSVAATAPADPAWPGRRANLAGALWRRDLPGDLMRSTELYREAAGGDADDPQGALRAASNWCRHAFQFEHWEEVTEAYERALAVSDVLLERQLTGDARRTQLRLVQGLPDYSAFAWARRGDSRAAVRALEAGRARLLADALELVASGVVAMGTEFVARRERAVRRLEHAERSLEVAGEERADAVAEVRRRRAELAAIMAKINALPVIDVGPAMAPPAAGRAQTITPAGAVDNNDGRS